MRVAKQTVLDIMKRHRIWLFVGGFATLAGTLTLYSIAAALLKPASTTFDSSATVSGNASVVGGGVAFVSPSSPSTPSAPPTPPPSSGNAPTSNLAIPFNLSGYPRTNNKGSYYSSLNVPFGAQKWQTNAGMIWNKPLPNTSGSDIDPTSAAKVAAFAKIARGQKFPDGTTIFTHGGFEDDGNAPYLLFVDSSKEQFTQIKYDCNGNSTWWNWNATQWEAYDNNIYTGIDGRGPNAGIPLPAGFQMDPNDGDFALSIYDYHTDIFMTFWLFKTSNITGKSTPTACNVGYVKNFSTASTNADTVSRNQSLYGSHWGVNTETVAPMGVMPFPTGANAAGLSDVGTIILLDEVRRGVINHAVGVSIPHNISDGYSWPANRNDGWCSNGSPIALTLQTTANCLYEGQRLRLPANYVMPSSITNPYAKMLVEAVKKYGFVVHDTAGCVCLQAESGRAALKGGASYNPWADAYATLNNNQYQIYDQFPWEALQVLRKDYGKP